MKKIFFTILLLLLVIITTLIKNSTKKIDQQIYNTKVNISLLKDKYELSLLDYNYLTSPEKLINYQKLYFENELEEFDLKKINKIKVRKDDFVFEKIIKGLND